MVYISTYNQLCDIRIIYLVDADLYRNIWMDIMNVLRVSEDTATALQWVMKYMKR